jgi:hypothetical protein
MRPPAERTHDVPIKPLANSPFRIICYRTFGQGRPFVAQLAVAILRPSQKASAHLGTSEGAHGCSHPSNCSGRTIADCGTSLDVPDCCRITTFPAARVRSMIGHFDSLPNSKALAFRCTLMADSYVAQAILNALSIEHFYPNCYFLASLLSA